MTFCIRPGEIFGLVGESGSGKSITALATVRCPIRHPTYQGTYPLEGMRPAGFAGVEMRGVRGSRIGMIFQEPTTALNPVFTRQQIVAAIRAHMKARGGSATTRRSSCCDMVGIPDPASRLDYYPHQLSGGMCQRVMIAMALAAAPRF